MIVDLYQILKEIKCANRKSVCAFVVSSCFGDAIHFEVYNNGTEIPCINMPTPSKQYRSIFTQQKVFFSCLCKKIDDKCCFSDIKLLNRF